jgi:ribonuclease VapC
VLDALVGAETLGIGAPTLADTAIVMESRFGERASGWLQLFVDEFHITEIPFGTIHRREAVAAYVRYGKGNHEAGLNFGDCLTHAVARLTGQPLLCVGSDFARTDLQLVVAQ